jgi:hypothetical protein
MGMAARRRKVVDTGESLYPDEQRWHVTRGIPLALIFTVATLFLGQTIGGVWYFAHQDSRLDAVEKVQITAATIGEKLQAATAAQQVETAKLGEKVVSVQASVNRIEALLTKPNR